MKSVVKSFPAGLVGLVGFCFVLPNCGGRSADDEFPSGATGGRTAGSGGSGVGGSAAGGRASGGASSGGVGAGGSVTTGGVPLTGGTGAGGSVMAACQTPSFANCQDLTASGVYFDSATGECRAMTGSCLAPGSQGGVFDSLAACMMACDGAQPARDVCDVDRDCELRSAGCCGACGSASFDDFVAENQLTSPTSCPEILCGACPEPPEVLKNFDYFWPVCENHVCTVIDLTQSEYGKCTAHEDCFLRDGTSCCGSCDGQGFVPLSSVEFLGDRCDALDCAYCDIAPPGYLEARCDLSRGLCFKAAFE